MTSLPSRTSALNTQRRPLLSPEQHRRLSKFWTRQTTQIRNQATSVTRSEMGAVMHPNGQLRSVASRLGGDLSGVMLNALVIRIRGILINTALPTNKQVLMYDAVSQQLVYNDVTAGKRWEPLVNGDVDDPQILFSADGDILMSVVDD